MDEEEEVGSLEIDEELTVLERIERYAANGRLEQRMVYVKELACCAEEVGAAEAVGRIVPLLKTIAVDPDFTVRQALAEQIVPLATVLLGDPDASSGEDDDASPTAKQCVLSELVPVLSSLLSAGPQDAGGGAPLAEAASDAMLELAALIDAANVGDTILRSVLCLAHDNDIEENRVVATQLLGSLAPVLGYDLCCQYVLPELVCLADDPAFRVRKAAALRVGTVATVVGPELTVQRLLPVFEVLARDEIWGVRKASVESLAEVSAVMPLHVRTGALERLMHDFHSDASRWVRISACQALGPFIATLPADAISTSLLQQFAQLANPANPSVSDADVAYNCAFNFPGVAQAVGRERWGEISEAFATLAANIQWKVRRTLSCSLHELAAILGEELTESELLPTFDLFIKDLDEVKVGVIQHLAAFIAALSPAKRLAYLPVLSEIRMETDNWRFRSLLASQLAAFGAAYPHSSTLEILLPLAQDLCTDSVAEVRTAAIGQIGKLLHQLTATSAADEAADEADELADEGYEASMAKIGVYVDALVSLTRAPSCHKRANCVQICASLIEGLPPAMSIEKILPPLEPLATDRVANVRLALATCVKQQLMGDNGSAFASLPQTVAIVEALRRDSDRDVLRMVHEEGYEPPPYKAKPLPPPPTSQLPADVDDGEGFEVSDMAAKDGGSSSMLPAVEPQPAGIIDSEQGLAGLSLGDDDARDAEGDEQPSLGPPEYGRVRSATGAAIQPAPV